MACVETVSLRKNSRQQRKLELVGLSEECLRMTVSVAFLLKACLKSV